MAEWFTIDIDDETESLGEDRTQDDAMIAVTLQEQNIRPDLTAIALLKTVEDSVQPP